MENIKELIEDIIEKGNESNIPDELNNISDELYSLHINLKTLSKTEFHIPKDLIREVDTAAYYDFEDLKTDIINLSNYCEEMSDYFEQCALEAEEIEGDEKKYGTYDEQVRSQYYTGKI